MENVASLGVTGKREYNRSFQFSDEGKDVSLNSVMNTFSPLDGTKIHATSGSISATLPELPGLSGRVSTTSGSFETGLPLTKNGDTYSCGDGSMHFDISTTSGSVRIN
jgi:hypothetical protein